MLFYLFLLENMFWQFIETASKGIRFDISKGDNMHLKAYILAK